MSEELFTSVSDAICDCAKANGEARMASQRAYAELCKLRDQVQVEITTLRHKLAMESQALMSRCGRDAPEIERLKRVADGLRARFRVENIEDERAAREYDAAAGGVYHEGER